MTKAKGIPKQAMLELRDQGKSNAEIAKELGCSATNVNFRIGAKKPRRSPTVQDSETQSVTSE